MNRFLAALLVVCCVVFGAPVVADAQATPPFAATVTTRSNLRSGPGTTYRVVDVATTGTVVQVARCNDDCSWYELADGTWIAARLVNPIAETAGAEASASTPAATRPYTMPDVSTLTAAAVVRIVDGDTIRVQIDGVEYPVRYIGVNTPEVGQPYADAATALNRTLVAGQTVYLEKDVSETDRYNRLLRYVWLADGTLVNYELVRRGYAQVATYPPDVKYEALYREAQRQAMAEGVGLWVDEAESTVTPVPVAAAGATANRSANLRGGPGTSYPIVGGVTSGQVLEIVGRNQAGDWYQLASGAWIAAFLVNNAPSNLPVAAEPAAPAPTPTAVVVEPVPVAPPPAAPTPTPVPQQVEPPAPAAEPPSNCDPSYPTICVPPPPPDLDCGDIPQYARFTVLPPDPHGFDGNDNDGLGCESN